LNESGRSAPAEKAIKASFCPSKGSMMLTPPRNDEIHAVVEMVSRRSRARLVAILTAHFRDVDAAQDALSEAFILALTDWTRKGCPANPEAWLLIAARRKLIDQMRRSQRTASNEDREDLAGSVTLTEEDDLPDRRLALLFACTHPAIDVAIRAPLMLQVVLGLDASVIASAFLTSPAAMAQRLVRAKVKIRDSDIPFSIPERSELPERLGAVLDSIYACYSEGWTDPAGTDAVRTELVEEAMFLGRLVVELLPEEPEALGLLALMLYTEARRSARRTSGGQFVPLARQDPALWNQRMIQEAEAMLLHAASAGSIGRYQLEAAIQSAHIAGARTQAVPWAAIVGLYDALVQLTGSPVARINRALAVAELEGPNAGLVELEAVAGDQRVQAYQPYWVTRAYLLARTGAHQSARHAYQIAIGLERDPAIRQYLAHRCEEMCG
jgi:predicted RNA polymerase sigma factor